MDANRHSPPSLAFAIVTAMFPSPTLATIIEVTPADSDTKIEATRDGDEVVIAPGTYNYRVYLRAEAPAKNRSLFAGRFLPIPRVGPKCW